MRRAVHATAAIATATTLAVAMASAPGADAASITVSWVLPTSTARTVNVGDTVVFSYDDDAPHSVIGGNGRGCSSSSTGGSCFVQFPAAGRFTFTCGIHGSDMAATITVNAAATTTTTMPTTTTTLPPPHPGSRFIDTGGSYAADEIDTLAASGAVAGCAADRFCPSAAMSRGEFAVVMAAALGLPPPTTSPFTDTVGHFAAGAAAALHEAGLAVGRTPGLFVPDGSVTRGEAAVQLFGAYVHVTGAAPPAQTSPFSDTATSFAADEAAALFRLGIVAGTTPTTFAPDHLVLREQMAVFVVRLLEASAA